MGVEVTGDYKLGLTSADGTDGDVDFRNREWRGVFGPLSDQAESVRVEVDREAGTITWAGGLEMAPEPFSDEARRRFARPLGWLAERAP
jgi:hypothetical protein